MRSANTPVWPKVLNFGWLSIGLFNYWIGFSLRPRKVTQHWRTLDLGYLKVMTWGRK